MEGIAKSSLSSLDGTWASQPFPWMNILMDLLATFPAKMPL